MNHHGFTGIATALAFAFPVVGQAQQAPANPVPVSLPTVVVQGSNLSLADPVDDGYVALNVRSAMKSNTSLLETPQAVNVITRTEMDQQGATSVAQAVRYTPGVVTQYGNNDVRYDWLTVRGFTPARYLDGLVLPFGALGYAQPRIETYGLERIEVLKGPSSGLFGQMSPGGLINMTTKKPTEERVREVGLQFGSYDRKEAMFDLGGGVNEDNTVLYRLTGVFRDSNTQFDYVDDDKQFIQGGLTFKLSDATRLTLSGQYQKIEANGGGGAPVLPRVGTVESSAKGRLPRSRYVGDPDYDRYTNEQTLLGYTLDHQINDRLGFKQTARFSQVDTKSRRVQVGAVIADTQAVRYAWAFPEKATAVQIDNQFNADLDWGRTTHRITAGVDYLREKADYTESQLGILFVPGTTSYDLFDLYNPNYGDKNITVPPAGTRIHQTREQVGLYLQDQISLDRWILTLTGRQDWASLDRRTESVTANTSRESNADYHRFTGRAALSYLFDNGVAPYISYSTSFQPVAGQAIGGGSLKPTTGKQIEVGVKYKPNNYDALLTASLFQIKQDNVTAPTADPRYLEQAGQVKSQGLELEAKASLSKALDLTLAYTYMDTEITKANAAASSGVVGNRLNFVPRHQAVAWADYTVQSGPLASLGIGAGVRYSSDVYGALSNAPATKTDGFTVFDAAIRYDLSHVGLKGADVSLNVDNLFDKKYVSSCLSANACYWGTERTVYANLRYRW